MTRTDPGASGNAPASRASALEQIVFDAPQGPWSLTWRPPAAALAGSVVKFWSAHGFSDYSREKILPHGCLQLIFNLGGPHQTLDLSDLGATGTFHCAWLAGVQERALITAPTYDTTRYGSLLIGATLTPIGARSILGIGGATFTSTVVELSDFLDAAEIGTLRTQLHEAVTMERRFDLLEQLLLRLQAAHGRRVSDCVAYGVGLMQRTRGAVLVEDICAGASVSRKHLNDRFLDEVGISPKRYARILRFAAAIDRLATTSEVGWADFALESGYYDQAHFVREFRAFSSETPSQFLRTRSVDGRTVIYND